MSAKVRIAHLAGPNATIQNTPPLVTSNKARARLGLPLLKDVDGNPSTFDVLRSQKLAAPVTVYVEQFSAHPLESDARDLYGPPDGYLSADGKFSKEQNDPSDRPVYEVELHPDDGYMPLPYMAVQKDGSPWETDGIAPNASREKSRQPFMPDGVRTFEEIDRFGIGPLGIGNMISNKADVDFYRVVPSGGYMNGNDGNASEEVGRDFFPYRPFNLSVSPPRMSLARITNMTQEIMASGKYDGAIWTQGSPRIEETLYWLNLVIDTHLPICGNASLRYHGQNSADGPQNIVDSADYIASRVWADSEKRNRAGVVLVEAQRVFAARDVAKVDSRPSGFEATGGHGGILGGAGGRGGGAVLCYLPTARHTYNSEVNISRLPSSVQGITRKAGQIVSVECGIKDEKGRLLESSIPKVSIIKDSSYCEDDYHSPADEHVDITALIDYKLEKAPLSGFVLEGLSPYGKATAISRTNALARAVFSGFPVVNAGRGNTGGFAWPGGVFIAGSNLTSTKARLLLMLCIMKFGMFPVARDPAKPTADEVAKAEAAVKQYQAIFDTH